MKFMLMMHSPRGNGDYSLMRWPAPAIKAHIEHMKTLNRELKANGELVAAEGLAEPGQARIVRGKSGGGYEVTDGPFAETKEFLAGWWIVDVETKERAHEIAGRGSAAPGSTGEPMNMAVEIREVMAGPPPV